MLYNERNKRGDMTKMTRNLQIKQMIEAGHSGSVIAERFGLTRARVGQIKRTTGARPPAWRRPAGRQVKKFFTLPEGSTDFLKRIGMGEQIPGLRRLLMEAQANGWRADADPACDFERGTGESFATDVAETHLAYLSEIGEGLSDSETVCRLIARWRREYERQSIGEN